MRRKYGWKKDPYDPRDDHYSFPLLPTLPTEVTLDRYLFPVLDQGMEGSCVGFGTTAVINVECAMENKETFLASPRWAYNGARFVEGRLEEEGAYPRDAFRFMARNGILPNYAWPYLPNCDTHTPPKLSLKTLTRPLYTYRRVSDGLRGICSALARGKPVVLGTPWFEEWEDASPDGRLRAPSQDSHIVGGHCYFSYGYIGGTEFGRLLCQNSWGTTWGKKGLFSVPMESVEIWKRTWGYDAYVIDIRW